MARDWVKLHTCLWEDEAFTELSNETLGMWTRMLALAGATDDNGRTRTPPRLARLLCQPLDAIQRAVAELDGRIVADPDGVLRFRDWHDWQPRSPTERVRAHRERLAADGVSRNNDGQEKRTETPCNVTEHDDGTGVSGGSGASLDLRDLRSEESPTDKDLWSEDRPTVRGDEKATPPPPAVAPASANGSTPQTAGREGQGKQGSVSKAKPAKSARPRDVLFDAWCNVQGFDPDNPGGKAGLARQFSARCQRLVPVPTPADVTRFVEREKARQVDGAPAWGTVTKSNTFSDTFVGWWQSGAPALRIVPKNGRATSPPPADGPDDWGWGTEPIPADPTLQEAAR